VFLVAHEAAATTIDDLIWEVELTDMPPDLRLAGLSYSYWGRACENLRKEAQDASLVSEQLTRNEQVSGPSPLVDSPWTEVHDTPRPG